jgi:cytochrome P450
MTTIVAEDVLHDLLLTDEGRANPYPLYRALHEQAPFYRSERDGVWYACRHATCRQLLLDDRLGHDEERMFRRPGMTEAQVRRLRERLALRRRRGFSMVTENPPDHTRLRRLVSRAFTFRRVEMLRPRIAELVDEHLDRMAELGEVDVMAELAFPLPVAVIGELVGVPPDQRERFRPLVRDGMLAEGSEPSDEELERAEKSFEELEAFFTDLIARRRAQPGQDLLSDLIRVRDEEEGRLSEDELMATAFLLFLAGFVTTTNLIGNGLLALLRHPREMERLWDDGSLVASAVEEMLRYDSPVQLVARDVLQASELEGVALAPDQSVVALLGAANRDPERFADPDRFDVGRADNHPLSFGLGIHHCLGAPLARAEGQIVFGRFRERFAGIEPLDPEPQVVGRFLRGLRSLRVRVTPR